MNPERITPEQRALRAFLYVRQSTVRQVRENTESANRQYGLRGRIEGYGWPAANIVVIDEDQGRSGMYVGGREGFQKLMAEVAAGHVGLVAAIEVSRLCRDSADWAQLVKVCSFTNTLLMDENGVYDPLDINDGLVLDTKGAVAKAEWRLILARCQGAIRSKAKKGEYRSPLPAGFVYDALKRPVLDPNLQVQEAIHHFFAVFRQVGSALGVVRAFRQNGWRVPVREQSGPRKGELSWVVLSQGRCVSILHNPRYAGIYAYGRRSGRRDLNGKYHVKFQPKEKWLAAIPGAHPSYITPEEFEANLGKLRDADPGLWGKSRGAPREGPALLPGLVMCGICGRRMLVTYQRVSAGRTVFYYNCVADKIQTGGPRCQTLRGDGIDEAVGRLLLEAVTPLAVNAELEVRRELQARQEEADRLRRRELERAQYEENLAHRQFLHVDPENRLVAAVLERDWNEKLEAVARAKKEYEEACAKARREVTPEQQAALRALTRGFASVWKDPKVPHRERKRIARLILEDVTLVKVPGKDPHAQVHVRFRGGETRSLVVPLPLPCTVGYRTAEAVVVAIRELPPGKTNAEIADILNAKGLTTGISQPFDATRVGHVRRTYGLAKRPPRRVVLPLPARTIPASEMTRMAA